ncbi:MAG: hypothetical protein EAZ13_03515 [Sphingobacteriia bacterium]|jgi:rhodanese-related sulfurtransferase|nr:MAG: hypothetical protein EAZ41_06325 [Sphingobacteriia bacterium]TAG31050.1 MAG: hypothetical protein EAZ35_04800 [Sphingobacteriia bacterium]TAH08350.1 MAG: hypothetical protein EAZ13_03515 [Sphingobacteriia bacterium]
MKSIFFILVNICFCAVSLLAQTSTIGVADFEQKMSMPSIQLLDVRTAGEYKVAHLQKSLQADWLDQKQFADRIQHLDKKIPVLLYCASGIRSGEAMKWMNAEGFTVLANLKGGLTAWKLAGKPLVSVNEPVQMLVKDFNAKVSAGTVLVDIGAEWCPPCKKMEPVLQQLQKELGAAFTLLKVDGGIDIEMMKYLQSQGLPTFIVYKNGKETWRKQGIVSYELLKAAVIK